MFINPIRNLDKTRFGINFKPEDIKYKLIKKENKVIKEKRIK